MPSWHSVAWSSSSSPAAARRRFDWVYWLLWKGALRCPILFPRKTPPSPASPQNLPRSRDAAKEDSRRSLTAPQRSRRIFKRKNPSFHTSRTGLTLVVALSGFGRAAFLPPPRPCASARDNHGSDRASPSNSALLAALSV
jgi:hypothetical protein